MNADVAKGEAFGRLPDGREARLFRLRAGGTTLAVTDYGATLVSLAFGGREVLLGHGAVGPYVDDDAHIGAVLGRVSGRIGGASFVLDGERRDLSANAGGNQLHGGTRGFSFRRWTAEAAGADRLTLGLVSEAGDEGFPGRLEARIRFVLSEGRLSIAYEARTDAPTPVSLTHHPYLRLAGEDVLDHELAVNAEAWTPLRRDGIPTGEVREAAGGPLDLRAPRRVGAVVGALGGLDHGVVCPGGVRARLSAHGHALTVTSDHEHCQLYAGGKLTAPFAPHAGLAIEPQGWPDAENQEAFPARVVRPGETYRRWVTYADG